MKGLLRIPLLNRPIVVVLIYCCFGLLWVVSSDWLLLQLFKDPHLRVRIGSVQGIIFVGFTSLVLYLLLKARSKAEQSTDNYTQCSSGTSENPVNGRLLSGFFILVLLIPLMGYGVILANKPKLVEETSNKLDALLDLKGRELQGWEFRLEHEIRSFIESPRVRPYLQSLNMSESLLPDNEEFSRQIRSIQPLPPIMNSSLFHADLSHMIAPESQNALPDEVRSLMHEALDSGQPRMFRGDLLLNGELYYVWLLPYTITLVDGSQRSQLLMLHINLGVELGHLLRWLPLDAYSGQLNLLTRVGSSVIRLSANHSLGNLSTEYLHSFGNNDLFSVAMNSVQRGVVEGVDAQGTPVIAAYIPAAGGKWVLVATMEHKEAMTSLYTLMIWITLVSCVAALVISVSLFLVWQHSLKVQRLELLAKTNAQDRLLRKFYDLPFVGMVISSAKSRQPIHCNSQLVDILGYTEQELKDLDWASLTHPDDLAHELTQYQHVERGETEGYNLNKRFYRRDGSTGYAQVNLKGVFCDDGTLEYTVTTLADVTQQKLLEESLRQREYEYRQLFMTNPLPMWVHDLETNYFLAANNAAEEIYGFSLDELLTMKVDALSDCQQTKEKCLYRPIFRHRTKYADLIEVELYSDTIEFDGRAAELVTVKDITQIRRDEADLKLAAAVIDSTREGVIITDPEMRIIKVNQAFCAMYGYTKEQLLGQTSRLFRSDRQDDAFYKAIYKSAIEEGHWQGELWSQRQNGEVFPELKSISAIYDDDTLTHYVSVITDISHLKASQSELEFLANHDALTHLPNRRLLTDRLQRSLQIAKRHQRHLAVLMLDLDRFKYINDSFGHFVGDELLKHVASRLGSRLRACDTLARLGGDEFVILLEDTESSLDIAHLAQELVTLLSHPILLNKDIEVRTGVSIGISLYPEHGSTSDKLLQHADTALYHAKEQGRGRFAYYAEILTEEARKRLDLEARLRRAIAESELALYFQPQLDMRTGAIIGAEALIRWHDPEFGLIMPSEFIPVAEQSSLIDQIGFWVVQESCRQGQAWIDADLEPRIISVNISPSQIQHSDFVSHVESVLNTTKFPGKYLAFELTETALMKNDINVQKLLARLRNLGIHLAIDDFGTGFSSLAYLKHFPLDVLKIDKSFVDDIEQSSGARDIVAGIIAMGRALGLSVLAEGVETYGQRLILNEMGCNAYQGFLSYQPLPEGRYQSLLSESQLDDTEILLIEEADVEE